MYTLRSLPLRDVQIQDSFFRRAIDLVREKVIPYQWEILNDRVPGAAKSHAIQNFAIAAGRAQGAYYGAVFQDSDVFKWLEAVSCALETGPDPKLEALADSVIELIGAAQMEDGYINTHYQLQYPEGRWTNLQEGHELYCAGHMFEAAVAHFHATGRRDFLDIACRFADCIGRVLGAGDGQIPGYPGHPEVEQALIRLADAAGRPEYTRLASYFVEQRGQAPSYFLREKQQPAYRRVFRELANYGLDYFQADRPPREHRVAEGHAVRAVYLYAAMADLAARQDDEGLMAACKALFDNITTRQMYITGGIGSAPDGERFTADFDLPNDSVYAETCASVGLMMFSNRMNHALRDARYIDALERALYNNVLSGMALTGTEFYYTNPLEMEPSRVAANPGLAHIKPRRQKWFSVSCCPPNIARTLMSLGGYAFAADDAALFVNLYVGASLRTDIGQCRAALTLETSYPYGNAAKLTVGGGPFALMLRSPGCAPVKALRVDGQDVPIAPQSGYIRLSRDWQGNTVELEFDVAARLISCDPRATTNVGKAAIARGPLIYCLEQADNPHLWEALLDPSAPMEAVPAPRGLPDGSVALRTGGYRLIRAGQASLYASGGWRAEPCELLAIPYHLWANREEGGMRVYVGVRV